MGSGGGVAAADETHAICLVRDLADAGAMHRDQVKHPRRRFVDRARAAGTEDRATFPHDLGLHEEIAEGRMKRVWGWRCDHYFRVTRDLDHFAGTRAVGDAYAAQLDVVLRRNNDLGMGIKIAIANRIATPKLRPPLREDRLVTRRSLERRLVGR